MPGQKNEKPAFDLSEQPASQAESLGSALTSPSSGSPVASQVAPSAGRFQLLPPLSSDDYAALKADIAERGVIVAVEYDEAGEIIDGYHRVKICKELGIKDYPTKVRSYPNDIAKRSQARKLNLLRRHLNTKTKRELIKAELTDNPDRSNLQVAKQLGVSDHTVAKLRESGSQNANQKTRTDKRGRKQPATKPKKPKAPPEPELTLIDSPKDRVARLGQCLRLIARLEDAVQELMWVCSAEQRSEMLRLLSAHIEKWRAKYLEAETTNAQRAEDDLHFEKVEREVSAVANTALRK